MEIHRFKPAIAKTNPIHEETMVEEDDRSNVVGVLVSPDSPTGVSPDVGDAGEEGDVVPDSLTGEDAGLPVPPASGIIEGMSEGMSEGKSLAISLGMSLGESDP